MLSWPLRSAPFALSSATNLTAAIAWAPVTNQPELSSRVWQVFLSSAPPNPVFYRLHAP